MKNKGKTKDRPINTFGKTQCLICGGWYKRVCLHAYQTHGVTAREYKEEFSLDLTKGVINEEQRERLRQNAINNNMGEQLKRVGKKTRFKKGHNFNYERTEEQKERLRKHARSIRGGKPPTVKKINTSCALCGIDIKRFPRHYQPDNNYCGVVCRNKSNNYKRNK